MLVNKDNLDIFIKKSQAKLEEEFAGRPYCEGVLSSSALSTAVSCIALNTLDSSKYKSEIKRALQWLLINMNEDGGWGDTVDSPSNLSTTLLCWAALEGMNHASLEKVEGYLNNKMGSLKPKSIVKGLEDIYGEDKTFAVPICMALAISGRLGGESTCWKWVSSLPFELAAVPQKWYQYTNMSVVSYAIPALISIGIVKHKKSSSFLGWFREMFVKKCLLKLSSIQPSHGGFLEAVPLTGFTAMALKVAGVNSYGVIDKAEDFLRKSIREDGSSPIDTNLSLWLTSLSLEAVAKVETKINKHQVGDWLCERQTKSTDPYAGAQAGGWAWTPLPGGVPDADDTSAALLALLNSGYENEAVFDRGIDWLLELQNKDGGVPTFCKGWGRLPFDQSCSDITAHAMRVFQAFQRKYPNKARDRIDNFMKQAFLFLEREQRGDGSWVPLWFGSQDQSNKENPVYGTSKVLLALTGEDARVLKMKERGVAYLLEVQAEDGGFGGFLHGPRSIEETALALKAIISMKGCEEAVSKAMSWLIQETQVGEVFKAKPIGLYFASLWYSEKLYSLIFSLDAGLCFRASLKT